MRPINGPVARYAGANAHPDCAERESRGVAPAAEVAPEPAQQPWASAPRPAAPVAAPEHIAPPQLRLENGGSAGACITLGLLLWVIAVVFLVVSPGTTVSSGSYYGGTQEVVNLQKLAIGIASAVCGAIMLAAGMRPRLQRAPE